MPVNEIIERVAGAEEGVEMEREDNDQRENLIYFEEESFYRPGLTVEPVVKFHQ